jgi:hypothetical protein
MSRVVSFFAKDLELKYAMTVSRSDHNNVVMQPEVVLALHSTSDLIVFRKHKHIFNLIKSLGGVAQWRAAGVCDWTYKTYTKWWKDSVGTFRFRDVIAQIIKYNPNAFIDCVKIRGDEDGIHWSVVDMPDVWSEAEINRIKLNPIEENLKKMGYAKSTYKVKGDTAHKIACFSKDNAIFEVIIEKNRTTVCHRYQSVTGYTFMLNKPLTFDRHINKVDFSAFNESFWKVCEMNSEKIVDIYGSVLISATQQHPTNTLSFSDRNLLEQERMFNLINYTRPPSDKIVY